GLLRGHVLPVELQGRDLPLPSECRGGNLRVFGARGLLVGHDRRRTHDREQAREAGHGNSGCGREGRRAAVEILPAARRGRLARSGGCCPQGGEVPPCCTHSAQQEAEAVATAATVCGAAAEYVTTPRTVSAKPETAPGCCCCGVKAPPAQTVQITAAAKAIAN